MLITSNGTGGIRAEECVVTLKRSTLSKNQGGALFLRGGTYELTNNFVVENSSNNVSAVFIDNSARSQGLGFAYNTVAGNKTLGGVDCHQTAQDLRDSIVATNTPTVTASQVGPTCRLSNVVVGRDGSVGGVLEDPAFRAAGDYHLSTDALCCIDRAITHIAEDFDGDRRPKGAGYDTGAHEVR